MRSFGVAVVMMLVCGMAGLASAGFDEGVAAYKSGDFETAYREFLPLARAGVAAAQFNLAMMYANGQGVEKDPAEAVQWFRKAAEQGNGLAQLNLGVMYANGQGVEQNLVQALVWLDLARASLPAGDARALAVKHRKAVASKMTPDELKEARGLARSWTPKKP